MKPVLPWGPADIMTYHDHDYICLSWLWLLWLWSRWSSTMRSHDKLTNMMQGNFVFTGPLEIDGFLHGSIFCTEIPGCVSCASCVFDHLRPSGAREECTCAFGPAT
jgi:hypothetical protein